MKYALYLGCLIPSRELSYELSVRRALPRLGVELVDMEGTNCCAPFGIQSLDYVSWLALAARNLCIAEEMGLDILALCNDCYESLSMTNKILKESEDVREKVNATLLDVGKEFRGKTNVKHMVDVLYEGVGLERIEKSITNPFKGLKAAVQAGCHLVRPKILHYGVGRGFDDLDRLVKTLGIEVADYEGKEICCGGPLRDIEDNFARNLSRKKLATFKKANVDCVVTVCPFCYMQFDMGQLEIKTMHKEEFNLPVVHFAELLSLAMGFQPSELQLKEHKIPADHILLKHSGG